VRRILGSRASGGVCSRNAAPRSCRLGIRDSATAPPQRCVDPWARRRCRCLGGRRRRSRITQASAHIQHPRSRTCLKTLAGLRLPRGPRQHASAQAQGCEQAGANRCCDALGRRRAGAHGLRARAALGSRRRTSTARRRLSSPTCGSSSTSFFSLTHTFLSPAAVSLYAQEGVSK